MGRKTYGVKIHQEDDGKVYQTQEEIEGFRSAKVPIKSYFNNGDFVTIFQEALKEIITKGELNKNELKLLIYLVATTGKDNQVSIDLNILTSDLKIKKPNVSTALAGLVERNIILRKDGYRYRKQALPMQLSVNYDQFNYDLAYAGKVSQYKKVKDNHPLIVKKDDDKPLDKYKQTNILEQIRETEEDDKN